MKSIHSLIAIAALAAPALFASPLPQKADLLASNTVVAHYLGTIEVPCRHMTADCPDKCGHGTKAARFRVLQNEDYQLTGKYGDDKITPGSILMVDIKKPTPGQDDAAVFEFLDTIKVGDKVRLTQKHYYAEIGRTLTPVRPITAIEKVQTTDRVPAMPAAPAGDYSIMPLAR